VSIPTASDIAANSNVSKELNRSVWIGFADYPAPTGYIVTPTALVCGSPNFRDGSERFNVIHQLLVALTEDANEERFVRLTGSR
jgi:hypothetical protein